MKYVINFGAELSQTIIISSEFIREKDEETLYQIVIQFCDFIACIPEATIQGDHFAGKLITIDSYSEINKFEEIKLVDYLNKLGYTLASKQVEELENFLTGKFLEED